MNERYLQQSNENEFEWGLRLISIKIEENPSDLDWSDIVDLLKLDIHKDTLRKASQTQFGGYAVYKYFIENAKKNITKDKVLDEIDIKTREMHKERIKLQTEKLEYNRWLREQSRIDLFEEKIKESVNNMIPINIPEFRVSNFRVNKEGILNIADSHYGKKVLIKGLKGEILNEYNSDVFELRMWQLLEETIQIINKEELTTLHVVSLGDLIDGILRMSQLQSLQYGIVDSVMKYSEFMANWLNKLSEYVNIEYYSAWGNHSQIRPLGSKNGDFPQENAERIVNWYLQARLINNQNIKIHNNESEFAFFNVLGINVMASHGEEKDLEKAIKDYSIIYGENIDIMLTGHLHSSYQKTASMDMEVIRIPSICGIDDFSMKLRKTSRPGSKLLIIEEGKGKKITYDINLN